MNEEDFKLELPDAVSPKLWIIDEERIPELNRLIEEEAAKQKPEWFEWTGILDIADKFKEMAVSFDQRFYANFINNFVDHINKDVKSKWLPMYIVLLQIMMNGYNEIKWDEDIEIKPLEISFEFKDSSDNKKVFVKASRMIMKQLNKILKDNYKQNKKETTPYLISINNCVHHIITNWYMTILRTFEDVEIIKESVAKLDFIILE